MPAEVTFREVLWAMAYAADANPDPAAGEVTLAALNKAQYTAHLQTAIRQLWNPSVNEGFAWPETVVGATVAVTDGKIARSLLGAGDYWSVWKSDPRIGYDPRRPCAIEEKRLHVDYDGTSIYPATSAASVFVFYRRAVPLFTAVRVDTGRTYNPTAGSEEIPATSAQGTVAVNVAAFVLSVQVNGGMAIVYTLDFTDPADGSQWVDLTTYDTNAKAAERLRDLINAAQGADVDAFLSSENVLIVTEDTGAAATLLITRTPSLPGYPIDVTGTNAIPAYDEGVNKPHLVFDELGTGHVYKAIGLDALGSDLADAEKWEVQSIPDRLLEPLHLQAEVLRVRAKGLYAESKQLQALATEAVELEIERVFYADGLAPWFTMNTNR